MIRRVLVDAFWVCITVLSAFIAGVILATLLQMIS